MHFSPGVVFTGQMPLSSSEIGSKVTDQWQSTQVRFAIATVTKDCSAFLAPPYLLCNLYNIWSCSILDDNNNVDS